MLYKPQYCALCITNINTERRIQYVTKLYVFRSSVIILKVQILKGDYNKNHSYKENIKVFVNVTIFHSTTRWSCNFINNVTTTDTSIDKKSCMSIKQNYNKFLIYFYVHIVLL